MPRILGVDIPMNKRVKYALQSIYGIGPAIAEEIIVRANIDPNLKASQLSDENISAITNLLQNDYTVEGDLRREIMINVRRLQAIGCYRGLRHKKGLPTRGQRTRTNARTRKGKRVTVGAIRDKTQRRTAASDKAAAAEAAAGKAAKK